MQLWKSNRYIRSWEDTHWIGHYQQLLRSISFARIIAARSIILASHSLDHWLYSLVGRRYGCRRCRLCAGVIHKGSSFSFAEAECCVGETASEACWEPCYCVLLQDEQTLTAYRSEDMAVSTFYRKSLFDSPGFIHPANVLFSLFYMRYSLKTRDGYTRIILDLHRCFLLRVWLAQCDFF